MGEGGRGVVKLTLCEESWNGNVTGEWKHWNQESTKVLSRGQQKIGGTAKNCLRRNRTFRIEGSEIPADLGQHVR